MATNHWIHTASHVTAADFKSWVSSITEGLATVGLAVADDTGQLDVDAISTLPAGGAFAGFQIWYLNDSLHVSAPIYIKLEYGTGSGDRPAFAVTVGSGTNGAGTLTGIFGKRAVYSPGFPFNAGTQKSFACKVEGCVWMAFADNGLNGSAKSFFFMVARSTDLDGTPTAEGAVCYYPRASWDNFGPSSANFITGWFSPDPYAASQGRGFGGNGTWCVTSLGMTKSETLDMKKQAVPHIIPFPDLRVTPYIFSILPQDGIASAAELQVAITSMDTRNYIASTSLRNPATEVFGLIWE